jgi:uncharacterized membrane protein
MDAFRTLVPVALLFIVCDLPWLFTLSGLSQAMVKKIQGGAPMVLRWEGAPVVYVALAYLLLQTHSNTQAFLTGLATYAVYDFTNYATLANYEIKFAIADSLWGGVLFSIVRQVAIRLNLL